MFSGDCHVTALRYQIAAHCITVRFYLPEITQGWSPLHCAISGSSTYVGCHMMWRANVQQLETLKDPSSNFAVMHTHRKPNCRYYTCVLLTLTLTLTTLTWVLTVLAHHMSKHRVLYFFMILNASDGGHFSQCVAQQQMRIHGVC